MHPPFITHPAFSFPEICHGFFTRHGGVSAGVYNSLNCALSSNDTPENIAENRARIARALGAPPEKLLTCYQIHSNIVHVADGSWNNQTRPEGDALVTNAKGAVLAIATADCGPVLFYDAGAEVIGAAHAGWKGALNGILENTLTVMERLGGTAQTTHVLIGACIQQPSYEVGPDFPASFVAEDKNAEKFFVPSNRTGHFMFDLPAYITHRLKRAGVTHITSLGRDTCTDEENFFSYRRKTLRGEPAMGTMLSAITLATGR